MEFNLKTITEAFALMSSWELLAVAFGIAYVLLAAKESLWTWLFAFLGTLIYTILFWEGALLSSSLLNFYYMVMAIYGFILWRGGKSGKELEVSSYRFNNHMEIITTGIFISFVVGYLSDTYTQAHFAYIDSFILIFSVIATWMLANKILENWLYWIVIDSAAVFLYFKSEYYATVILFLLYVILAFWGYYSWNKDSSED